MIDQTLTTKFVESFSLSDDLLTSIIKEKQSISLSLKELSKLHHLQKMLEEFQFLNIVYSETSRVRKMILNRTKSNLNQQFKVCQSIDKNIDLFMKVFASLDNFLFQTMNTTITQENCLKFLQDFAIILMGGAEFTVVYEINKTVNGLSTKKVGIEEIYQSLLRFKESTQCSGKELHPLFEGSEIIIYKNKYSYLVYEQLNLPFKSFPEYKLILDQFVTMAYDFQKEIFDKDALVSIVRGIKSRFIKNSTRICQEIIRNQVTEILETKCFIEMPDQIQYMNELIIDQQGCVILPVRCNKQIKFYIKIESPNIDMITFSDYVQQLWLKLTFELKELKNQDFLRQMLEVNSPNKLILQLKPDFSICYQSCCIPSSWYFMNIMGPKFEDLQMEEVNKQNVLLKKEELKQSAKGAVTVCQINFSDKCIDLDLFAKRNEEEEITEYYLVFNAPKKKFDETIQRNSILMGSDTKLQELNLDALVNIKNEKLSKACIVFREYLKLNLTDDEIIDLLKEKDIIKEVYNQNSLTDDVRQSYVMEYYKAESLKVVRDGNYRPVVSEKYLDDSQLTNIKKFDLFSLDQNDISNLSNYSFDITLIKDHNEQIRYTWAMFHLSNFVDMFQLNKETLYQFLVIIQEKYNCRKNPFHNYDHGFTVAHAVYYLIKSKSLNQFFDKFLQFTLLVSGLCHDVDHTGRNNNFESLSLSKLAIRHNDESVLENHHCSVMFKILQKDKYNILCNLSSDQFQIFRKYSIQNILATDMKKHLEIIKQLELRLSKLPDEPLIQKEDDKKFLSGAIVHTCDLTGQSKIFSLAKKWSYRIAQEFSNQMEDEIARSLPITPHFLSLKNPNFEKLCAKQEIGFIKFIVKPAFELTAQVLQSGLEIPMKNLEENIKEWERQSQM